MDFDDEISPEIIEELQTQWGELNNDKDFVSLWKRVTQLNRKYLLGELHCTPNRVGPLKNSTLPCAKQFAEMSRLGFVTTESQVGAIKYGKNNTVVKRTRAYVEGFVQRKLAEFLLDELNAMELIAFIPPIPDDPMKHVFFIPVSFGQIDKESKDLESTKTIGVGETFSETFGKIMPDSTLLESVEKELVFIQVVDPIFGRAAHEPEVGINDKIIAALNKFWKKTSDLDGFSPQPE